MFGDMTKTSVPSDKNLPLSGSGFWCDLPKIAKILQKIISVKHFSFLNSRTISCLMPESSYFQNETLKNRSL